MAASFWGEIPHVGPFGFLPDDHAVFGRRRAMKCAFSAICQTTFSEFVNYRPRPSEPSTPSRLLRARIIDCLTTLIKHCFSSTVVFLCLTQDAVTQRDSYTYFMYVCHQITLTRSLLNGHAALGSSPAQAEAQQHLSNPPQNPHIRHVCYIRGARRSPRDSPYGKGVVLDRELPSWER